MMLATESIQSAPSAAELGRVAAKLFFAITDEWQLSDAEKVTLAGVNSRTTLRNWKQKVQAGDGIKLPHDALERLSYIAGIYKALQLLFPERQQWAEWVNKPNRDFGGQTAMQRMLGGKVMDLADMRRYLDGWRGAHYE